MLLAIDTATAWMSVALHDGERLLAEQSQFSHNMHTARLTVTIQRLLAEQDLTPQDLRALAISAGAGSFSGLRVGFGVAKGLASALHIPLISVPTLDIVAYGTPFFEGTLLAVVQAGRKRIIVGGYVWRDQGWQAQEAPQMTTWEALLTAVTAPTLINGEIDEQGAALLKGSSLPIRVCSAAWNLRRAGFLAELGWERFTKGAYPSQLAQINPIYLKEP